MVYIEKIMHKNDKLIYEMLQDIGEMENNFNNEVKGLSFEEYLVWEDKMIMWDLATELPKGYVRQSTFIMYDGEAPIGIGKVRYKLTDKSRKWGGTIGYAVKYTERGKGYGSVLVKKLVEYAKKEEISDIVATILENNISSMSVTEKAGGKMYAKSDGICYYKF